GEADAMEMLARPVPLRVMSEWLGLDLPAAATTWADASFRLGAPDPPVAAAAEFADFFNWAAGDGFATVRAGSFAGSILAGGDRNSARRAFGAGIHLCLGAPLARLEGISVFRHLADRVGSIEVLAGAERTDSAATRGFATLPVRVVPR